MKIKIKKNLMSKRDVPSEKYRKNGIRSFLPYQELKLLFYPFTNDEILK